MKWQSVLAGALASVFVTAFLAGTASADMRIVNDPGGEVSSYVLKFNKVRATGERVVIDGPCLSACTLLIGIVPRHHVCVTNEPCWVSTPRPITTMFHARWCQLGQALGA